MHYYREPHPFFGLDVLVIGGKNSAAIAALELWRHGARVTLVHRGPGISNSVKYWIKPDIENRIKAGQVKAYFNTRVREITLEHVVLDTPDGEVTLPNDYVFALTGYHPDFEFLCSLGIELSGEADKKPDRRSADAGEQRAGNLSGRRDRGRHADQRNLHREWTLSRRDDRRRSEAEAEGGAVTA